MTGCDRILSRLERGPATAAELYAETFSVVHSRISELRRRGHAITCERVPGQTGAASYLYSLSEERATLPRRRENRQAVPCALRPLFAEGAPPSRAVSSPLCETAQLSFLDPYSRRV